LRTQDALVDLGIQYENNFYLRIYEVEKKNILFVEGGGGHYYELRERKKYFFIPLIRWFAVLYKDIVETENM
jgi:hypothetical protein